MGNFPAFLFHFHVINKNYRKAESDYFNRVRWVLFFFKKRFGESTIP